MRSSVQLHQLVYTSGVHCHRGVSSTSGCALLSGTMLSLLLLLSHSVVSDSKLPNPSPTPGVYPNPCPLSQWCHPTISSSVVPFSSCLQSFPASRSFPVSSSHQVAKYWSFSFSISPSSEYSGLISCKQYCIEDSNTVSLFQAQDVWKGM